MSVPPPSPANSTLQLKVSLLDVSPEIWRRALVPGSITLPKFDRTLQELMGWWNYHLHMFVINDQSYGIPDPDWDDVDPVRRGVKLASLVAMGDTFTYQYDFGDNWEHLIEVESIKPVEFALRHAVCLDGARACPREDVGGTTGYEEFLAVIADLTHEEHQHYVEWSGGDFDPEAFIIGEVNARLQQVR